MTRRAGLATLLACVAVMPLLGQPAGADAFPVEITARPLSSFSVFGGENSYGPLTYFGGFSMTGDRREFGQLSSFRFLTPGEDFMAVADHGYWVFGRILRDRDGAPVGMADFIMQPMLGEDGAVVDDKELIDAEGLSVEDDVASVVFERRARLSEYRIRPGRMEGALRDLDFLIPRAELRYNAGMETIARSRADGPLQGARIVVAERSIDTDGNIFAAIVEGPRAGIFKVRRTDDFDITDGVFLPDGDLLLLERRFSLPRGIAMRIRRIAEDDLSAGALVDGDVLIEAGMTRHIDNMEGIDVWRREDGRLVLALMSDDNQSWAQRSLYLEFILDE